jgi:cytochrome b subunit of formate dehydrogenase
MTFQIVLHWIVALPYMFLLLSGALLMLSRLGLAKWVLPQLVAPMHKVVGIAMTVLIVETLLAALVGGYWRTVGRDVVHWVSVFWHDIVWLAKVPLNTFFPRQFPLPSAGRFNAGQKLHGMFILCAVSGFIVTGFMMIFRPAWLRPWMIHTWLFFGAVGFLALHLFLGLVNPVTRRALGGMFTGDVPLDYVQAHHALELEEEAVADANHPAAVSWKAMAAVAVLVAVAVGIWWGRGGRESFLGSPTVGRPHGMIMPGMLIAAHAEDPKAQRCEACHVGMGPPQDSACLACHTEIARVMRDRIGYHGQLTGTCASCHGDHKGRDANLLPLDTRNFNHQLARFSLKGAHQTLQCGQCHVQRSDKPGHQQFVGLQKTDACTQCHTDPHKGQFSEECTTCHSERGWTGRQLLFVHNRDSSFQLNGKHEQVACTECHKPQSANATLASATFTGVQAGCASCHTDPHRGQFKESCTTCHTEQGWKGKQLVFSHKRDTRFPLRGKHAELHCQQCHSPASAHASLASAPFAGLGTQCRQCHNDPHGGQFQQESCTTCHGEQGWKGQNLLFDHNRDAPFKIDAIHAGVACSACHRVEDGHQVFRPLTTSCDQCHTSVTQVMKGQFARQAMESDPHNGRIECTACHNPSVRSPMPAQYADACEKCHTPVYRDLFFDWQRSLDQRESGVRRLIQSIRTTNPSQADAISEKVGELQKTGIHNVQATLKTLDEILTAHPTSLSVPRKE